MGRPTRTHDAIEDILTRINSGEFKEGHALPPEAELANLLNVSRPTMREAVTILRDRGVLDVVHGNGTYVRPHCQWTDMPTLINALSGTMSARDLGCRLVELRRMLEVGAAGLAAMHRSQDDIDAMRSILDDFNRYEAAGDFEAVARCDMEFHHRILTASSNPFIIPMLDPLNKALLRSRIDTTLDPQARARARISHEAILKAIADRDPAQAKDRMRAHMSETREAIETL